MPKAEKDIVLILADGGMMGVFVAGALEVIDVKVRGRVASVYATSVGADVGAYFVSNQARVPYNFFMHHLVMGDQIQKNFVRYVLKVLFFRNNRRIRIPDYINVEYVVDVAKNSDCKMDLDTFERSEMEFYVKVIDIASGTPLYLSAKTNVFEKLKATSQCGPMSTKAIPIDGKYYIDGGTLRNNLDVELVKNNPDTMFIFVQPWKENYLAVALLYPLHLLAGHVISVLYGKYIGKEYVRGLFVSDPDKLLPFKNVIFIKNDLNYGPFCTNKKKLERAYHRGIEKAEKALRDLKMTDRS